MKHIAIFQYDLGLGGIQKSLINLLTNLDKEQYQVDLYLFNDENFYDVTFPENITVYRRKAFHPIFKVIPFSLVKLLHRVKIQKQYDIAIDFNSYQMETAVYALKTSAKRSYIWCHNDVIEKLQEERKYRVLWNFFKRKFYQFDKVCAVSGGVRASVHKQLGIALEKIEVIPNFVDAKEILCKAKEEVDFEVDPKVYNVCILGRICHQKGIDIALHYWQEVRLQREDIHLYIIGDGEELSLLKNMADDLNLSTSVSFLGRKANPFPYLNKMDGFLLTSRYEGQGIVLLEAKVLGLSIFMPKHLERYISEIQGSDHLVNDLVQAKKQIKAYDDLSAYNSNILDRFAKL